MINLAHNPRISLPYCAALNPAPVLLTNDSDEFVAEPRGLGGEQGERGGRVFQVHVDGVDVDAAALAHARNGFPAGQREGGGERTR